MTEIKEATINDIIQEIKKHNKRADINRLDKIGQSLENLKIHLNENIIPIVLKRVSSK